MSNNINNRNERNLRRPQGASVLNDRATNNQNAAVLWLGKIIFMARKDSFRTQNQAFS